MALCTFVNRLKMFRAVRDIHVLSSFRNAKHWQKPKKLPQIAARREPTVTKFSSEPNLNKNLRLSLPVQASVPRQIAFSTHSKSTKGDPSGDKFPKPERKKTTSPKITLLSTDEDVSVMTLEEAQKLSKRRDLKLVKIIDLDTKTQRPLYKLMTGTQYFEEDMRRRTDKTASKEGAVKSAKLMTLTNRISEHDLGSKIKNMNRWLSKRHEVRVVINGEGKDTSEKIFSIIESETKAEGKLLQKRWKGNDIRFQLVPLKKETNPNSPGVNKEPAPVVDQDSAETRTVSSST